MTDNFKKYFGKKVKAYRKLNNLSQEKLSEMADITSQHLSSIERGQANPTFDKIIKLIAALGIKPYELFLFDNEDATELIKEKLIASINETSFDNKKILLLYEIFHQNNAL